MRILVVGKGATEEELRKWRFDGQRRLQHRPSHHGWHYAHAFYRVKTGRFEKGLYLCETCGEGLLLENGGSRGLV